MAAGDHFDAIFREYLPDYPGRELNGNELVFGMQEKVYIVADVFQLLQRLNDLKACDIFDLSQ